MVAHGVERFQVTPAFQPMDLYFYKACVQGQFNLQRKNEEEALRKWTEQLLFFQQLLRPEEANMDMHMFQEAGPNGMEAAAMKWRQQQLNKRTAIRREDKTQVAEFDALVASITQCGQVRHLCTKEYMRQSFPQQHGEPYVERDLTPLFVPDSDGTMMQVEIPP